METKTKTNCGKNCTSFLGVDDDAVHSKEAVPSCPSPLLASSIQGRATQDMFAALKYSNNRD